MQNSNAVLYAVLLAVIVYLYFQTQKKSEIRIDPNPELVAKIDSLEKVKSKVDTIYKEVIKESIKVVNLRPQTDNPDTLNQHIDKLEMQLMDVIDASQQLKEVNNNIIENQKLLIQDQSEIINNLATELEDVKAEKKIWKIAAVTLGSMVVILAIL